MRHTAAKGFLLALTSLFAISGAQQQLASGTEAKTAPAKAKRPGTASQLVFGSIRITSTSAGAREQLEVALNSYETAQYPDAVVYAKRAAAEDPQCALAYALWSYAARWNGSAPDALQKAMSLSVKSTPDEKLLVQFMVGAQQADVLPAIIAMNDLVSKHPKDKHVLFLAGDWLLSQGDYTRGRKLLEKSLEQDENFPPALNTLGYAYVDSLDPEPERGIDLLRRYADVSPDDPNPQDSLGEVLRMTGDDAGSLARYAAAMGISPTFLTSQFGRGDTFALMGKYSSARDEYDKALKMAPSGHDVLHIEFQKTLVYFWQGDAGTGRNELAALSAKAAEAKDGMAQFEIDYARVLLAPDTNSAIELLAAMETRLTNVPEGMTTAERNQEYASVLREEVRIALANQKRSDADGLILKLDELAAASRDQKVESIYESARGYVMSADGDYANAADELMSDLHSPLVVQQLVVVEQKLSNADGAEKARARLKYLRTPTAEWYVVSKKSGEASQSAAK
jgi:tetratricopeptide (TPR) repeat protein